MSIKAILFDLDGTLLPVDTDEFATHYLKALSEHFNKVLQIDNGYQLIYNGVKHSFMHSPHLTNREAFFSGITKELSLTTHEIEALVLPFYDNEYNKLEKLTKKNELAKVAVQTALDKGYMVIIATNPLFPYVASYKRACWAGIDDKMYTELSSYENYHWCKPSVEYYNEIIEKYSLKPEECVMVGNDVSDDLTCAKMGMLTFWHNDYPINQHNITPAYTAKGSFQELIDFIFAL